MSVAWSAWLGNPANPVTLTHGDQVLDTLDLVVRGLADGTDPAGRWYWGDIGDRTQQIVEAAEVAFCLWTGRDRIVPALGPDRLRQVLGWLAQVHGRDVYADNWVLFPAIVATVSRGLGESVDDRLIDEGIERMLSWYAGDGWYSDGEGHAFDRYTGWAIHWHLLHWAEIDGDRRPDVRDLVTERARTWLRDLPAYAAEDGAIPLMGRSLGYRFATAGPLGSGCRARRAPHRPRAGPGCHRPLHPIPPRTRCHRPRHGLVPGRCLGAAPGRVRAIHVQWCLCVGGPCPGAAAAGPGAPVLGGCRPGAPIHRRSRARPGGRPGARGDPGYLVGRRPLNGGTWVASALMDHPDDIPGHDYRPSYGKWLYHTDFPFTNNAADGRPGPDGTVVLEGPGGGIGHRELVDAGGAGADWTWSRYPVDVEGSRHGVSVVSIRVGDAWVRAIGLRPTAPVRAVTATLPLGVADASMITRQRRPGRRYPGSHRWRPVGGHQAAGRLPPGARVRARTWWRRPEPRGRAFGAAVGRGVHPIRIGPAPGARGCGPFGG